MDAEYSSKCPSQDVKLSVIYIVNVALIFKRIIELFGDRQVILTE